MTNRSTRERTEIQKRMAPAKNSKPSDYNPWGWVSQVKPEDVNETHVMHAYRILGFQPCVEARLVNLQIP